MDAREAWIDAPAVMSRRRALRTMASGFGYLAFASLAHEACAATSSQSTARFNTLAAKAPHFAPRAKRIIFLCMQGGPSHVDMFDYKEELNRRGGQPTEIGRDRGGARLLGSPFKFARHGECGHWFSSVCPEVAKHADDICFLHGMHTDIPNHPQAFGQMHTGSFQFVRPSLGAWTLYGLGSENANLPGFITLNPPADNGGARNYGSAFLPAACQGTRIGGGQIPELYAKLLGKDEEPGPPLKHLENGRLSREAQRSQLDLVRALNQHKLAQDVYQPEIEGAIESFELAFRMQAEVPDVLDISGETEETLALYGIGGGGSGDRFGRQCLMARRLAEAGVRFIEITAPVNWDHHRLLEQTLTRACEATDGAVAALLSDLKRRGLLDDTLVIWAGEFGRTPYAQSFDGRDHNNKGFTLWMAGGGVKGGHRHGATDEFGYQAVEGAVHIHDWHATILHLLGLDHKRLTYNYAGRDFRLTNVYGEVVKEILA